MAVLIETTLGDLVIDLFVKERPNCSLNFLKLCKTKYYNFCQFHHIQQNYIAQTGDPTGSGRGGESIYSSLYGEQARYFEKEEVPKLRHNRQGLVSFVNNGNGMLGSQFYITLGDDCDYLDDQHTIFGQVTEGIETIEKLNEQLCTDEHRPFRDIRIAHTIILADPFEDDPRLAIPARSPSPTYDRIFSGGQIAIDEDLHDHEGMTEEELKREMEEREMQAQAQILEIVGDLRSADDVPPENVLFVCKLNPVTTDEDLEIIFARFGKVECCEIIRDRRTGRSLQYAFIEYSDPKFVEAAYLKMDNVLIDDRRIYVDFSQSVSKNYKWHKGQGGRATELNGQGNENRKPVERRRDDRKPERPVERRQRSRSPRREPRHEERRDRRRVDERDQRRERDRREHRREREREVVVDRWGEVQKREIKREASSSPERSRKDRRQSSPKRARRDASPARKIKKEVVSSDDERDRRDRKDKKKEKKQRRSSSGSRSPSRHRRR